MARSYTASPLFQLAPRKRRITKAKARELRVGVSLWVQISYMSAQWATGNFGNFQWPKAW